MVDFIDDINPVALFFIIFASAICLTHVFCILPFFLLRRQSWINARKNQVLPLDNCVSGAGTPPPEVREWLSSGRAIDTSSPTRASSSRDSNLRAIASGNSPSKGKGKHISFGNFETDLDRAECDLETAIERPVQPASKIVPLASANQVARERAVAASLAEAQAGATFGAEETSGAQVDAPTVPTVVASGLEAGTFFNESESMMIMMALAEAAGILGTGPPCPPVPPPTCVPPPALSLPPSEPTDALAPLPIYSIDHAIAEAVEMESKQRDQRLEAESAATGLPAEEMSKVAAASGTLSLSASASATFDCSAGMAELEPTDASDVMLEREERRIDPLLQGKAVTFREMCLLHADELFSTAQLRLHWADLRPEKAASSHQSDRIESRIDPLERRIDPLLEGRAVTFSELCESYQNELFSETQLRLYWADLRPEKAARSIVGAIDPLERRIDPLLQGRALTFSELVQFHENELFTEAQLHHYWADLRPAEKEHTLMKVLGSANDSPVDLS